MPDSTAIKDAARYLSARTRTEAELRSHLVRKGHGPSDVDGAIAALTEEGLIGDEDVAARWAEQLAADERIGPLKALRKLIQRGVPANLARRAIDEAWSGRDDASIALKIAEDAMRGGIEPQKDKASRAARLLEGKGFSPEDIAKCLRRLSD